MSSGIGFYLVTTKEEQRPNNMALDWQNTMEACEAGASQQIDKEGFDRIVAVVGSKDGGIALLGPNLLEEIVAQLSRRIFHTEMKLLRIVERVELRNKYGHTVLQGQLPYKLLITVAVVWAQVEVAVGNGKWETGCVHQVGQYHRIDAATNSKQHLLPRGEEMLLLNVRYKLG